MGAGHPAEQGAADLVACPFMKLVTNAVLAVHAAAAAEALALGVAGGVDQEMVLDILTKSPAASCSHADRAFGRGALHMIERAADVLHRAQQRGWGAHDITALAMSVRGERVDRGNGSEASS